MHDMKKRKALLVTIIVVAVIAVGWVVYKNFMTNGSSIYEERAGVIDQIANGSIQYGNTSDSKSAAINAIQKDSAVPSAKKATPQNTTTQAEKQAIIDGIQSSSTQ